MYTDSEASPFFFLPAAPGEGVEDEALGLGRCGEELVDFVGEPLRYQSGTLLDSRAWRLKSESELDMMEWAMVRTERWFRQVSQLKYAFRGARPSITPRH